MTEQLSIFEEPVKTKVVHCKKNVYDIYIGRGQDCIWGNPYSHKENTLAEFKVSSVKEAIEKYREYLKSNEFLLSKLHELKGRTLGCWCKDANGKGLCHGDILAEFADKLDK